MWKWIIDWWHPRKTQILEQPHNQIRKKVDTNTIRARIATQGWKLLEVPMKKSNPDPALRTVLKWRIVASKGERTCEVTGPTIDDAIKNLGMTLGVIGRS